MSLRITVDIFSGRPNPSIEVSGKEEREILERVKVAKRLRASEMGAPEHVLGYRGLIIEQIGEMNRRYPKMLRVAAGAVYGGKLSHDIADPGFEKSFVSVPGFEDRFGAQGLSRILQEGIDRLHEIRKHYKHHHHPWPGREHCHCAPLYEPNWWNDAGQKQFNNNCYKLPHRHIRAAGTGEWRGVHGAGLRFAASRGNCGRLDCGAGSEQ